MTDRAQLFLGEHVGATPLEAMVGQAWDIEALGAGYESFLDEFSSPRPADSLVRLIELYSAWTRLVAMDPELPRELLPKRWHGTSAASLFLKQHARWEPGATTEWDRLNTQET
jgi:phenylacetic acid degradation operon negative regulatory protein